MEPIAQADDYEAVTARLLRQTSDELQRERDALRAELHEAQARIAALEGRVAWTESVLAQSEAARQGLEAHLGALQSGLGWAILQRFRDAKARLLRPGSAVERAYARLTRRLARRFERP